MGEKPENGEKEESPSSRKRGHGVMAADVSGNPPKKEKFREGKSQIRTPSGKRRVKDQRQMSADCDITDCTPS